jgi:anti-sigma B factor antagonist
MNIDRILKSAPPATIVDLSGLEYLDSSGLGLLLSLSKEYGAQGGKLVLVTSETVNNILSLTRLNGIFSTATDLEEAMALVSEKV